MTTRLWHHIPVRHAATLLLLAAQVGLSARVADAADPLSGLTGSGNQDQQEQGTGWVRNPFDFDDQAAAGAGWRVLGNEWPGASPNPDALILKDQGLPAEARQWYQQNLPTLFYHLPDEAQGGGTGQTRGAATAGGRVLPATTGQETGSDDTVLQDARTCRNGLTNFCSLARYLSALEGSYRSNLAVGNYVGTPEGLLPRVGPAGIELPPSVTRALLEQLVFASTAVFNAGQGRRPPASAAQELDKRPLSTPLPAIAEDPQAKAPCANGTCDSRGNVQAAAVFQGHCSGGSCSSFGGLLGGGPFQGAFSGMLGNILGQIQQRFGLFGNDFLRQFLGRFPGQGLPGLSNRFGDFRLDQLLNQNGFLGGLGGSGGGGGAGGGGIPPRVERPPRTQALPASPGCPTPRLSVSAVADVADVLGLPRAAEPWSVQFQSLSSLGVVTGTNPETNRQITIGPESLPGEACAWIVRAGAEVVIASDRPSGGEIRIIP